MESTFGTTRLKLPESTTRFSPALYYVGMNTDASSVPSFEYGTVTTIEDVPVALGQPNRIGDADSGSVDQQNGIITVVLSSDKIGGPKAGGCNWGPERRELSPATETNRCVRIRRSTSLPMRFRIRTQALPYMVVGNAPSAPTPTPTPTSKSAALQRYRRSRTTMRTSLTRTAGTRSITLARALVTIASMKAAIINTP